MRLPRPVYYSCLISALVAGSARAQAQTASPASTAPVTRETRAPRAFRIPAADASDALAAFSRQSGTAVVYIVDHVRGIRTNNLDGRFPPRDALERLVANTPLAVVEDARTGALMIKRAPPPAATTRTSTPSQTEAEKLTNPSMKTPRAKSRALPAVLVGWLAAALAPAHAQTAPKPSPTTGTTETVTLSPFEVTSEKDYGYVAGNTLGATRVNTPIRDLPLQINVITEEMIRDFAAYDLDQVIDHIPGVSREFNEFTPTYGIRGFSSSAAMRNGVRTLHAPDANSIARVEVIKGPAALLYGTSNPGGVINYITRQPGSRTRAEVSTAFGNNGFRRYGLGVGGPLPIGDGKKISYLLDAVWFEHGHGERQRSLARSSLAPVLRWMPFAHTNITLRATRQKDDFISSGGLLLKPSRHPDLLTSTPRIPHWAVELGRDANVHSPSSWVDVASSVYELELQQRLTRSLDLRVNLSDHYRPRSSFREGGSRFRNTGDNVAVPPPLDNLAPGSPVSLTGIAPPYDPVARTGWRTIGPTLDDRLERRRTLQLDLVGRFRTDFLSHTLLGGFERNLEAGSSRGRTWRNAAGQNVGDFTYAPHDPVSIAAKDRWVQLNQPPLESLPINSFGTGFSSNSSFYASLTSTFLEKRGLILAGARRDDVKGGSTATPVNFRTGVVGTQTGRDGVTDRVTPQAGASFRVVDPVTVYLMFSQSVNPRVAFQPLRTAADEKRVLDAYANAGEPAPNLDTLPWNDLLDPEFGTSVEYGLKWEFFDRVLQGTVAVFDIERRNISSAVEGTLAVSGVGFRVLSGKTRARGVDLDVAFSLTRDFQIIGGMLFNETEILTSNTRSEIGRRMNNAPRFSGSLTSRYAFSKGALKGFTCGASWTYMSVRRENDLRRWSEGWNRTDMFASYRTKLRATPVTFSFNVKNLLDRTFRVDRDTFAAGRELRLATSFSLK